MKKILILTLALMLSFGVAIAQDDTYKFQKEYENKKGVVTFNHEFHSNSIKTDCDSCHEIRDTFFTEEIPEMNKDIGHKFCKECHKSENDNNGFEAPTKCSGCHVK